jgi:hypothetical protein
LGTGWEEEPQNLQFLSSLSQDDLGPTGLGQEAEKQHREKVDRSVGVRERQRVPPAGKVSYWESSAQARFGFSKNFMFIVVLGQGTLWQLQKFLQ